MRALLFLAVLVSLVNCPVILLTLDDSHSVAVVNEHGVEHLVFFHTADSDKNAAEAMLRAAGNEENHEVHLQNTTGLLRQKLAAQTLIKDCAPASEAPLSTYAQAPSQAPTELDVGALHRPVQILRI